MFAVSKCSKRLSIKQILATSTDSLVLFPKIQLLSGFSPLNGKAQIFEGFCSLANVDISRDSSKKKRHKYVDKPEEEKLYTVSYLVNKCGLSQEKALSASQRVHFRDSSRPDSVLALLERYGFSKAQVTNLVRIRPETLLVSEKILVSKIEFFQSIGVPKAVLAMVVSRNPTLLTRSLENGIIPNYKFLKTWLVTDEKVATAMKRASWIFLTNHEKVLAPNVKILRDLGVPDSNIKLVLAHFPETFLQKMNVFKKAVEKVSKMGFCPSKSVFVQALHAVSGGPGQATWAQCCETYSNWGWSKDDIYMAFRKYPNCMMLSREKISRTMDFLVNTMGKNARSIATYPIFLAFSLEKRIIPRCSVIQVLLSRGILAKRLSLSTFLMPPERAFLEKYVLKYKKELPGLDDVYKGKLALRDCQCSND